MVPDGVDGTGDYLQAAASPMQSRKQHYPCIINVATGCKRLSAQLARNPDGT